MDRKKLLNNKSLKLFNNIHDLYQALDSAFLEKFDRSLPFGDNLIDRWERAKKLGFGNQTNIYDSSIVIGNVIIGENCWIGPNTMLDGSGGIEIGNYCTISAGVHIYSHDNVKQTIAPKHYNIEQQAVSIGKNVYIGPNTIITKGIKIGDYVIIGAGSYVNKNIEKKTVVVGQPAKKIGKIQFKSNGKFTINYL